MASKLAEAYIEITSKHAGLDADLAASESKLSGFIGRANGLLGAIGIGLAAGGAADFLMGIADAGADLGETMNKVQVVFGGASGIITAMSDDMAAKFGSVKTTTLDAAANIGLIGQAAGMTATDSARLAEQMVRLADDSSSFFNVPLDVALEKIRSGLVGEAEPLRQFGVLLSESAVKQQALAMGFQPVHGALTEQEKVLARVEIITKSLAKAQGDHARTMGSYKNMVRQLSGEWENMKADVGTTAAGTLATMMKLIREKPGDVAKSVFSMGMWQNFNFQDIADQIAGVDKDTGKIVDSGTPTPAQARGLDEMALAQRRMAQEEEARRNAARARFDANKEKGGGFGAFGMFGTLGLDMARQQLATKQMADLDQQIAEKRRQQSEWGGGHVTDPLSFLKQAQEKILKPTDETAKKQLAELEKSRALLEKIANAPRGSAGLVLRGREN